MFLIFLSIFIGTILVQTINVLYTKTIDPSDYWGTILPIAVYTLPAHFIVTFFYSYYFTMGIHTGVNYFYLLLTGQGLGLVVGLAINFFFLNGQVPSSKEVFACLLILSGTGILLSSSS